MSILMPSMPHFSHYDPYNAASYSTALFDPQEAAYLDSAAFSPSYATPTPHAFPVDPRWFNTSYSGHAIAAPHHDQQQQLSSFTHSVITPPDIQTDLLSLSPSSTIAPIPPLAGSRNRSRSMSNRIRSFNPSTRLPRQSTGSARSSSSAAGAGATSSSQQPRIARRSTVSSSPATAGHALQSPNTALQSPAASSYLHSPTAAATLEEDNDGHETRALKRRRTDDVDSASLQSYSTVPEPPHLLTPTQPPHLLHGYPSSQTWAGPPSAGHITHGHVSPDHHGYSQWPPAPLPYFAPHHPGDHHLGQGDHHLHHHHHHAALTAVATATTAGSVSDHGAQTPMLPYPSPTVAGPAFFHSPEPEAPMSAISTHFQFHKMEPDSPSPPRLLGEDVFQPSFDSFEHGPTEFPPRAYPGGPDAKSPYFPTKPAGKIFGSRLEQMPAIENRLAKLEDQLDHYLDIRAAQSLKNSLLPGLENTSSPIEFAPLGPCRMFGGRIWPTALARRVRRTPRD